MAEVIESEATCESCGHEWRVRATNAPYAADEQPCIVRSRDYDPDPESLPHWEPYNTRCNACGGRLAVGNWVLMY